MRVTHGTPNSVGRLLANSRKGSARSSQSLAPKTAEALADWNGQGLPPEAAWEALVRDLAAAEQAGTANKLASILNQDVSGIRSVVIRTAREAANLAPPYQAALTQFDRRWAEPGIWGMIKRLSEEIGRAHV